MAALFVFFLCSIGESLAQTRIPIDTPPSGHSQDYNAPQVCGSCHPRQYAELRQAVHAGYANASPLFNALELAGNALAQRSLESGAIQNNLRPIYATTPRPPGVNNRQMVSPQNEPIQSADQQRAAFCIGCHNGAIVGDIALDPTFREIPEWDGALAMQNGQAEAVVGNPENPDSADTIRPLRDYHLVDGPDCDMFGLKGVGGCEQVLPLEPGGPAPAGVLPSLGATGISCETCHNAYGPDHARSLQGDGFGNTSSRSAFTATKVGPFLGAFPVKDDFHASSFDRGKIDYLRSNAFCISCHDVRVPNLNAVIDELNITTIRSDNPQGVPHYRLENLGTEHVIGPYNTPDNPFGEAIRCQDCHMSLFPYGGETTYTVHDADRNRDLELTSPTPAVFPMNLVSLQSGTVPGYTLPMRPVATHYFTGVDIPLLSDSELKARLGPDYPSIDAPGVDEYGTPLAIRQRRADLLRAAVRMNLDLTDEEAALGETFHVRVTTTALTGHRFPSGFSQERTTYVQLTVTAKRQGSQEDFILYQSGYVTDKPHYETAEPEADGQLDDEDVEHVVAIVNPFTHHNEVFYQGPDNGPEARIFEGKQLGLVLFRNELLRISEAGEPHPRTGEPLEGAFEEETFSAGFANAVDNWRSLPALRPRTSVYAIDLPSAAELAELGIVLEGPLQVKAAIHFNHFPPLFMRFLARVAGAVEEQNLFAVPAMEQFVGLRGPYGRDLHLVDENHIDSTLRNVLNIDSAERSVPLASE